MHDRNRLLIGGIAVTQAVLALLTVFVVRSSPTTSLPAAGAQPPPPSPDSTAPAAMPGTDAHGFVNSGARCDASQTVISIGRTERSQFVVCADQTGNYEYRGVRLSDGAVLKADVHTVDGRHVARNDGVTYTVTASELLITSGGKVIRREPVIDYRQPGPFAAEAPPR